jgi:hypothetical protein
MFIYHLLIRPYPVTRFLFGMKPKKKETKRIIARGGDITHDKSVEIVQPAIQIT